MKSLSNPTPIHLLPCLVLLALLLCPNTYAQPAKGFNEIGTVYFQEGRYAEALERFEKALELAPDTPAIMRNLALCHQALASEVMAKGDSASALKHVETAITLAPENPTAHVQAGSYNLAADKLEAARKHYESALELDPKQLEARAMMGEIHYRNGDLDKARDAWSKVRLAEPDFPGLQERLDKLDREMSVESDFAAYSSAHFQISSGEVLSEEIRERVFKILEDAYQEIGTALGGIFPTAPTSVVLYEGEEFAQATGADRHIGALFDGKIRAPITSRESRYLSAATLSSRLRHEYVHVVLRDALGPKVPWWFNEGLAETLSRKMDGSRIRLVRSAYRGGNTIPFAELETNPRGSLDHEKVSLAYAQSHVAVEVLWNDASKKFPALIQAFGKGSAPEAALKEALGLDYAALDKKAEAASQK